jgi:sigma-B regulation protein RsbU (phosphoserine phosphatase)
MNEQMQCMEVWGGNRGVEQHFQMPGLEVWLYSVPHDAAASGGDVYYLSSCASGRISRLLLADVSGHGLQVSKCALRLRDLMRSHVNSISQAKFVEGMNEEFTSFNQGGNFATAIVGTFFAPTGSLQLCAAGHPQPLLYREATQRWELLDPSPDTNAHDRSLSDIPLGIVGGVAYNQARVPLAPGDMLLGYTDGLIEARVEDDRLLGIEGLKEVVRSLDATQPQNLIRELLSRVKSRATSPYDDDLTILLARANRSRVPLKNNLLAPLRLLRKARDATSFRGPAAKTAQE